MKATPRYWVADRLYLFARAHLLMGHTRPFIIVGNSCNLIDSGLRANPPREANGLSGRLKKNSSESSKLYPYATAFRIVSLKTINFAIVVNFPKATCNFPNDVLMSLFFYKAQLLIFSFTA